VRAVILLDGKALSKKIRDQLSSRIGEFARASGFAPGLATVLIGDDPASRVYVNSKGKSCGEVGIRSWKIALPGEVEEGALCREIDRLNQDPEIHGILVQLPLPAQISTERILSRIDPEKDVDGFHPVNVGRLSTGRSGFVPCTPLGVMRLLEEYGVPVAGSHAVVVGRSNIVGKPMAQLLLNANATVTVCHSRTRNLPDICRQADVLVAATGKPEMIRGDWVREGAAVVDVGIHRREDGKLTGDVAFNEVAPRAGWISPVPGGVGPLTIAMLLSNTLDAAQQRMERK
jgi:methylenetetrahydrofolate dehydrogenase (NADP+)/methenyltetrahydrofolate cyclohydrolase